MINPSRLSGGWREGVEQMLSCYTVATGANVMELAFLGEDLQVVQGVAGAGAGAHEGHVLLAGEGHWEVELDEDEDFVHRFLVRNLTCCRLVPVRLKETWIQKDLVVLLGRSLINWSN